MITEISMKLASQNAYKVMSNFGHKSLAALKCADCSPVHVHAQLIQPLQLDMGRYSQKRHQ